MTGEHFPRVFSPWQSARDDYILAIELEGRSAATLAKYRHAIARLAGFVGEVDPATIDAFTLRRFTKSLAEAKLATATQATYLTCLKTWLLWLHAEGGYGIDPQLFEKAKTPTIIQEPIVPYTEAELVRLFADAAGKGFYDVRQRALLATLLDTGVRQSEILGLHLGDLNLETGDLTVRVETDKTRKGRTIGLGRRARLELSRWWQRYRFRGVYSRADDAPLFITYEGQAIKRRAFQHLLNRLGERAGVAHVHPHRFRHTFAIMGLRAGMDPFVLMHTLGHRDMAMTKKYMAIVDADVREAKRATSPLDKLKLK